MKNGKISEFVYILTLSVWFFKFTQWYCILSLWGVYTFEYNMIFKISKLKKDFFQKGQIQYKKHSKTKKYIKIIMFKSNDKTTSNNNKYQSI